jgi:hypothetical protein
MSNDNTTAPNASQSQYLNDANPNFIPPFTSAKEMTRAMKNPLYMNSDSAGGDPAFRAAVERRVAEAAAQGNGLGMTVVQNGTRLVDSNR